MASCWKYRISSQHGDYKQLSTRFSTVKLQQFGLHEQTLQDTYVKDLNNLLSSFAKTRDYTFASFLKVWNELKFAFIFHGRQSMREKKWFIQLIFSATVQVMKNPERPPSHSYGCVFALYCLYHCQFVENEGRRQHVSVQYGDMLKLVEVRDRARANGATQVVQCVYKLIVDDIIVLSAQQRLITTHIRYAFHPWSAFQDNYAKRKWKPNQAEDMETGLGESIDADVNDDNDGERDVALTPRMFGEDRLAVEFGNQFHLNLLSKALSCYTSKKQEAGSQRPSTSCRVEAPIVQEFLRLGNLTEEGTLHMRDIDQFLGFPVSGGLTQRDMRSFKRSGDIASLPSLNQPSSSMGPPLKSTVYKHADMPAGSSGLSELKKKKLRLWKSSSPETKKK